MWLRLIEAIWTRSHWSVWSYCSSCLGSFICIFGQGIPPCRFADLFQNGQSLNGQRPGWWDIIPLRSTYWIHDRQEKLILKTYLSSSDFTWHTPLLNLRAFFAGNSDTSMLSRIYLDYWHFGMIVIVHTIPAWTRNQEPRYPIGSCYV